ncbi:MAG: HEPN domain-containing protein [Pseudomonadota bacterium]
MTLLPEERQTVISLRMQNAEEALSDAGVLLERNSLRGAANRLYYAVFHALSALALGDGKLFAKHQGIISFFHADCVRTGRFEKRFGRVVQQAFEDRTEADYEDDVSFSEDVLRARIRDVRELINVVKQSMASKN